MVPRNLRKTASDPRFPLPPGAEERRSTLILENAPEMLALIGEDGVIQYVNAQLERVLGFRKEEVQGRNIFDFIHPEDAPRAAQEYSNTVQREGERIPSVLRLREVEGAWVPVEIVANNQLNNPDLQAVVFAARDLRFRHEIEDAIRGINEDFKLATGNRATELASINAALRIENQARRRAESELQHTISLLNATLESTADGLLVVSADGRVTSCNKKFLEMWQFDSECPAGTEDAELLGQVLDQLQNPEEFVEKVRKLYADPSASSFDIFYFKDGRIFERYSQPQTLGGRIVGRVWSFRDVTHSRTLEVELRQAQKMEALGRLAGGIAHDFNNLLMLISGYVNQLVESSPSEETKAICDQILATTRRAASVTRQLLAFSRKLPESPIIIDLNAIVLEIERLLRRLLSDQIRLKIAVASKPLPVFVDASQIEVMILNLAINAQDAMPEGGVLSITTSSTSRPARNESSSELKSFAVLEVSDTGHGMTPEVKTHIFEPFFTTKQIGKGTGLGLSIVFGIVERAGGRIEVQSEQNAGATFFIYLPETTDAPAVVPVRPAIVPPGGGTETILVAEDEEGIRSMTRAYLEGLGYRVLEAADGTDAVKVAQDYLGTIDVMVTDVLMPGMRGDAALKEIRKARPDVKAIFVSGYADQDGELVAENVLYKPFDFPELGRRIRSTLDDEAVARSGEDPE